MQLPVDDTAIQAAAALWRDRADASERACMRLWHSRTEWSAMQQEARHRKSTHVTILLIHMAQLEPDVEMSEGAGWIVQDVSEALGNQTLILPRSV